MGLGVADRPGENDAAVGGKSEAISCSICLEFVTDTGDRSWAKLLCGHQFHLDCIGSAFNAKGSMQCPNCRKIEKGQWLYGNGNRPLPEFNVEDWVHDEDLYDISYSEMSFGVHWCPFSGLTRLPSPFDDGEFSANAYHDLLGHHAIIEHTTVSSTSPYITYVGPVRPSSTSTANVPDGSRLSSFANHWTGTSVPSEVPSPYGFPSADVHYHNWDHSSPLTANNHIGGSDQTSIPSVTQRPARNGSDMPRPGMQPYILNHNSINRAPSSVSSMVPPYLGIVSQPRDRPPSLQTYFQQSTNSEGTARAPLIPNARRSSGHRGLTQVAPVASSSDQSRGVYFFSSPSTSGRTFQDSEYPMHDQSFHGWERELQPAYPMAGAERDPIWGPFHPPAGGSDVRSNSLRQRHGPGRMPQR